MDLSKRGDETQTEFAIRLIRHAAWDEGWQAAREVVELDGLKCWAHTVLPDGYEPNPYRD